QVIIEAINDQEIEQHYIALLDSLGDNYPVQQVTVSPVKQYVDYTWIDQLPFSSKLKERLQKLRYAEIRKHYYFRFNEGAGNVKITNELKYDHMDNPDVGLRLLSLFRYWNIVQYFSPYRYLTDVPWDQVLDTYMAKMINSRDALEYQMNVSSMLNEMKD